MLYVIIGLSLGLILIFYHYLPVKVWRPFELFFQWVWSGVKKLDSSLFNPDGTNRKVKRTRFQKIASPFGKALLMFISLVVSALDMFIFSPISRKINEVLESEKTKKLIKWIESQNIIILRILIGVPFLCIQLTGILAGFLLVSNPLLGVLVYSTKVLWFIPFTVIKKIGYSTLDKDPWYKGLEKTAIRVINAVKSLGAMQSMTNLYNNIKDFVTDSNYSNKTEIRIRRKLAAKSLKEIFSLHHLGDELNESDEIELVFFTPKATKILKEFKENPDDENLKESVINYIKTEINKDSSTV